MNKKLGFTLIELLAVILILGILSLIAIPIVSSILKESRLNAAVNSGHNYMKAVENKLSTLKLKEEVIEDNTYTIKDKALYLDDVKIMDLDVKGTMPDSGKVYIKNGEITKSCLKMNGFDIAYDGEKMINKDCKYAFNLIENGYLENKNNDNFSQFDYEDGYLKYEGPMEVIISDNYIQIDTSKAYKYTATAKSDFSDSFTYLGLEEYDIDKNNIADKHFTYGANSLTKLKTTLNNGDTIVYLEDVSNFNGSEETYKNGFIFWNYTDSTGYTYPPETYSRNVFRSVFNKEEIDKNSNSITLKEPWNKGTIESGTYVSQSSGGCTYNYSLINSKNLNTTDTKYNGVLKGEIDSGYCEIHKFKPATKYVKVLLWHNYSKNEVKTTYIKDLSFEQVY